MMCWGWRVEGERARTRAQARTKHERVGEMSGLLQYWQQGDAVGRGVGVLLLLMSVTAWSLIVFKTWLLLRVRRDLGVAIAAFWRAEDLGAARVAVAKLDREGALLPLVDAAHARVPASTLEASADPRAQLTRRLREGLHAILQRLAWGQVLLASVGSVAPFVGLLGTVWGIYHAMLGMSADASLSLDKVAGPVAQALIMTAAGLAVAIPAVLAFNVFGKWVAACEADLEGFAHDVLHASLPDAAATPLD